MAKQNFIAKTLCSLGGDKYILESTERSLYETLQEAEKNIIPFDIHNDKWKVLQAGRLEEISKA